LPRAAAAAKNKMAAETDYSCGGRAISLFYGAIEIGKTYNKNKIFGNVILQD